MATARPSVPTPSWAYKANQYDENDPLYQEIIERPSDEKLAQGWEVGEKPSHKHFNWMWKKVWEALRVLLVFGLMPWDENTPYKKGSVVVFDGVLWMCTQNTSFTKPPESAYWTTFSKSIKDLDDTLIDLSTDNIYMSCGDTVECGVDTFNCAYYILQYSDTDSKWHNAIAGNISLPRISDIFKNPTKNSLLVQTASGYRYENVSNFGNVFSDVLNNKTLSINDLNKFSDVHFTENEYDTIYYKDNNFYNVKLKDILNTDFIQNKPTRLEPEFASKNVYGGARFEVVGDTLYINTNKKPKIIKTKIINNYLVWETDNDLTTQEYIVKKDNTEIFRGVTFCIEIDDTNANYEVQYV